MTEDWFRVFWNLGCDIASEMRFGELIIDPEILLDDHAFVHDIMLA